MFRLSVPLQTRSFGHLLTRARPAGSLSVDRMERMVVDASHIDQKKRGVMDMKDTMMPLARWLARKELKDRYADPEDRRVDLMFF